MFLNGIIKKDNFSKAMNYILIAFLIIQPIFDLKVFYNSISTLIRVIIIGILFLFYFFQDKNKKKYLLFIYPLILLIYIVFHHINANHFTSLVPGNFNYSLKKELLYFIKMLAPFVLIYALYVSNINKEKIIKIIKYIVLIIGLIIIVSNIFMFSYSSYNDQKIKGNFFTWFNNSNNYTYQELSSKGLFEFANQISAILLMFLPFVIFSALEKKSFLNIFTLIINIFSLFLLATKVAVFGVFIVFVYTVFIYVFKNIFIDKNKKIIKLLYVPLIIFVLYVLILPINPSFKRIDETKTIEASSDITNNEDINVDNYLNNNEKNNVLENEKTENIEEIENIKNENISKINYIEQNYEKKEIKKEFILERYPYKYDPDFWINILNEPRFKRVDYRFIEESMIKRVIEINNNKLDILFGITNTRVQNIFNIEKDFVVQYYALGIVGLILILIPYFVLLFNYLIKLVKIVKNKFKNIDNTNLISFITILMTFAISYYSGNMLNSLSFTVYFVLLFKLLISDEKKA